MGLADRARELHSESAQQNIVEIYDQQNVQATAHQHDTTNQLNKAELEFLLKFLKNADLKGYQVEMFYNLVVKIQNQYVQQK
jgi:hypothetical protein